MPLATGLIDAAISAESSTFYGAYWGELTRFAVLDIDEDSKYHNAQELQRLTQNLASCGLSKTCHYQSSRSGGWHLYIPFDDWAPSKDVQSSLKAFLRGMGYDITGGQLEVFPCGNGLRLPLQVGFAWLDENGDIVVKREALSQEEAISRFLDDLETNANDWAIATELMESRSTAAAVAAGESAQEHEKAISGEGFDDLFTCRLIRENYEKGRKYWLEGLTEPNQRHDAVICIEHYLWHGDQAAGLPAYPGRFNDDRRYRLIREWLEENHNGLCKHINAGDWATVEAQIRRACLWRSDEAKRAQEYEPYPCTERAQEVLIARSLRTGRTWTMDDLKKGNDGREKEARKRIKYALVRLQERGEPITVAAVAREANAKRETVRRHKDLFAGWPGDKNRGVQGGPLLAAGSLGSESSEENFLDVLTESDSADLDVTEGSCSEELEPIDIAPPFLLPGVDPSSEPPASRPSPTGAFGSLDAGAQVRCYSGRTADGAGGSEPSCKPVVTASDGLFVIPQTYRGQERQPRREIICAQAGLVGVTTCYHSVVVICVHSQSVSDSGSNCRAQLPLQVADIGCIRLQSVPFRLFVYGNVRGPPMCARLL